MSYLIDSIDEVNGIFKGVVIEEYLSKAKRIFKIRLCLANNYTYAYSSIDKLKNVNIGSCLLLKLSLINLADNFSKDKYPVLLVKSILNNELIDDVANNIKEISNSKIKKINNFIEQNREYLFNLINDYDDYYKDANISEKVSNYLEIIKLATYSKVQIVNNEIDGSIDVIYRKEGMKKDVEVFSIIFDETFTAFEYLDKFLFFETNDKYVIFSLINKIFKHFNIRLDKNIDLEMKFIEVFATNENIDERDKAKEEYKKEANVIGDKEDKKINLLKDKKLLIIGRGALEHRQNLIYDICCDYGFNKKNITIESDNNKIISKGNDYIQKIKNNVYCGVIVGQTPHSSTGKNDANSFIDQIKNVANPKYCYVHVANIPLSNKTQKIKLKLSKARLKSGLDKIIENILKRE